MPIASKYAVQKLPCSTGAYTATIMPCTKKEKSGSRNYSCKKWLKDKFTKVKFSTIHI